MPLKTVREILRESRDRAVGIVPESGELSKNRFLSERKILRKGTEY